MSAVTGETAVRAADVAAVARLLARAELVEAFGHVSARADADGFFITSIDPLGGATPADVHRLDLGEGLRSSGRAGVPLETPLHAAIYNARPDVSAICRTHSRWAVAWGVRGQVPPILHGLGALAGSVALWPDIQLVSEPDRAGQAATELGANDCLLLTGNGALATGRSLESAAVRAWFLEERCRVAMDCAGQVVSLSESELAERSGWSPAEEIRAWRWLQWRFGNSPTPDS